MKTRGGTLPVKNHLAGSVDRFHRRAAEVGGVEMELLFAEAIRTHQDGVGNFVRSLRQLRIDRVVVAVSVSAFSTSRTDSDARPTPAAALSK